MEGLIDVKINTNANNYIVYRSSIAFKQKRLIDANDKTIIKNIINLDRLMNDVDDFVSSYKRSNCKFFRHNYPDIFSILDV